jgi:ribosomal protein S4
MTEFIKEFVENLINPKQKEVKRQLLKYELQQKFEKSLYLKEYLKTKAWQEFHRKTIYSSLESGMGRLLRDGLTMSETDIKAIISDMRANLNQVIEMRFAIEAGEDAGLKLEKMK